MSLRLRIELAFTRWGQGVARRRWWALAGCAAFALALAWRLPDLAWGSEAWAMLKVTIPVELVREESLAVLQVAVSGTGLDGRPITAKIPALGSRFAQFLRQPQAH